MDLSMEPHRDSLLDAAPSQFFSGFRLREKDEGDAAHMEGEQTIGISVRGFLWFIALLYPFMGLGFLCSAAAQFLVDEAGNPIGNLIKTDPDLKSIHGFVGTILGKAKALGLVVLIALFLV